MQPSGSDYLRYRLNHHELKLTIKWRKNYQFPFHKTGRMGTNFSFFFSLLTMLLNRTIITATPRSLQIITRPIDYVPMSYYPRQLIYQLYVKKVDFFMGRPHHGGYGLYIELTDGQEVLLLWDLMEKTLLFIEQELERVLDIDDKF